jgi:peroxiredoxin
MNHRHRLILRTCFLLVFIASAFAVKIGDPAPGFTVVDSNNHQQHLSDYKGKYIVLEWHNRDCSAVKKHYESGNMQRLQKDLTAKGVVWLTIVSAVPGTPGFVTPSQETEYIKTNGAAPTAALLDMGGSVGRLYGVKMTPEMFVIAPDGNLIYSGALNDQAHPSKSGAAPKNYVAAAVDQAMAGKPVTDPLTVAYGCAIKYKD